MQGGATAGGKRPCPDSRARAGPPPCAFFQGPSAARRTCERHHAPSSDGSARGGHSQRRCATNTACTSLRRGFLLWPCAALQLDVSLFLLRRSGRRLARQLGPATSGGRRWRTLRRDQGTWRRCDCSRSARTSSTAGIAGSVHRCSGRYGTVCPRAPGRCLAWSSSLRCCVADEDDWPFHPTPFAATACECQSGDGR